MRKHTVLTLALVILASVVLFAGVAPAREDVIRRITNQQHSIDQGVSSGSLTRHEAEVLQDNLNYIRESYTRARVDGRISWEEENRLQEMLDQNGKMIYRKKHNLQVRRLY